MSFPLKNGDFPYHIIIIYGGSVPEIHVPILCEISEPFLALVYINLYQSPYLLGLIVFDLSMPFQTIHIFSVLS